MSLRCSLNACEYVYYLDWAAYTQLTVAGLTAGIGHQTLPACSRDPEDTHPDVNLVHDVCSETVEVLAPSLPRTASTVRDMARIGRQGEVGFMF